MPPAHILNAPTKLMKELGYGAGYAYDHEAEEAFSGQNYFPDGMAAAGILPAARPRLRARDRQAAGVLGQAARRNASHDRRHAHRSATDEADIRLDRWFRRHFPALTKGAIQKLCRTGQVRVDGHRAEAATRLAPGQAVRVPPLPRRARHAEAGRRRSIRALPRTCSALVLYRDDQLIVLNKPHGLPVQGGPGITHHLDGCSTRCASGLGRPRLVHRLDRDTSGVLVLARTPGHCGKTRRRLPRPRSGEDLLGGRRRPAGAAGGAHRPATAPHRRPARRTHRRRRAQRHGSRPRAHRLPHAGPCGPETRLAGAAAADRAHAPIPRALRRHRRADPGRRRNTPRPDQDDAYSALVAGLSDSCTCTRARCACRIPPVARSLVEADLPPHMRETFGTLGFHAPPARPPSRTGGGR